LVKNDVLAIRQCLIDDQNVTFVELAKKYQVTASAIWSIAHYRTWQHLYIGPIPKRKVGKLTKEEIMTIRERASNGEKYKNIAKDFPVNEPTIYMIVNYKIWRNM